MGLASCLFCRRIRSFARHFCRKRRLPCTVLLLVPGGGSVGRGWGPCLGSGLHHSCSCLFLFVSFSSPPIALCLGDSLIVSLEVGWSQCFAIVLGHSGSLVSPINATTVWLTSTSSKEGMGWKVSHCLNQSTSGCGRTAHGGGPSGPSGGETSGTVRYPCSLRVCGVTLWFPGAHCAFAVQTAGSEQVQAHPCDPSRSSHASGQQHEGGDWTIQP